MSWLHCERLVSLPSAHPFVTSSVKRTMRQSAAFLRILPARNNNHGDLVFGTDTDRKERT